jgi:hypothetical protein
MIDRLPHGDVDLFGHPDAPLQIVRLDRSIDRERPCCQNLATIRPTPDGPHAAELRCAGCQKHRGWLPREAMNFLAGVARLWGAPTTPITLRDNSIGDHEMSANKQHDNCGILFRNNRKESDRHPDFTGTINVNGTEFWLNAWVKQGQKAKFMSLSVMPKDATKSATTNNKSTADDMNDSIGF